INIDTTAPAVTLTSVNGTARTFPFSSNVTVTSIGGACGTASGDNPLVSVVLTGAGSESGTAPCSTGAWTYTFATPLTNTGAYSVTATQTDTLGNTGTTGAQAISVDTVAPVVSLTTVTGSTQPSPLNLNVNGTAVGGACGTAAGDSTTVSVAVTGASTQNGAGTCTAGTWTYTFSPALSASGTYTIT